MTSPAPIARRQIGVSLIALADGVTWGDGSGFVTKLRKWKDPSAITGAGDFPVLIQVAPVELVEMPSPGAGYKVSMDFLWLVYTKSDPNDDTDVSADDQGDILDAIELLFPAPNSGLEVQDLGGLVHRAQLYGTVHKVSGDDTGLGVMIVPIRVYRP